MALMGTVEQFAVSMTQINDSMKDAIQQGTNQPPQVLPLILNFEAYKKAKNFKQYRERFDNFAALKGIKDKEEVIKQMFLNCTGSEIYETAKNINAPKTLEELTYKEIVTLLESHLCPMSNPLIEQYWFHSHVQNENESINEFIAVI